MRDPVRVFGVAVLLAGSALGAQSSAIVSGRYALRAIDGRSLPYIQNWENGRLMFAIEGGELDFYRADSVRIIVDTRDGVLVHVSCGTLRQMQAEQGRGVATGGLSAGMDTAMAGCDDLRVEHDTTRRAFTVTNHSLAFKVGSEPKYDVPFSGEARGDTVVLWRPRGNADKKGHARLIELVYVREQPGALPPRRSQH